jgi:hypothetical protein
MSYSWEESMNPDELRIGVAMLEKYLNELDEKRKLAINADKPLKALE